MRSLPAHVADGRVQVRVETVDTKAREALARLIQAMRKAD
jgi:hypothetical protein